MPNHRFVKMITTSIKYVTHLKHYKTIFKTHFRNLSNRSGHWRIGVWKDLLKKHQTNLKHYKTIFKTHFKNLSNRSSGHRQIGVWKDLLKKRQTNWKQYEMMFKTHFKNLSNRSSGHQRIGVWKYLLKEHQFGCYAKPPMIHMGPASSVYRGLRNWVAPCTGACFPSPHAHIILRQPCMRAW